MSERTRHSLERWIITTGKHGGDYLFTAIKGDTLKALSVERLRMLVKDWVRAAWHRSDALHAAFLAADASGVYLSANGQSSRGATTLGVSQY